MTPFNLDARDFMAMLARKSVPVTQVIMNLPASAETFCDVFRTCFTVRFLRFCDAGWLHSVAVRPLLHVQQPERSDRRQHCGRHDSRF